MTTNKLTWATKLDAQDARMYWTFIGGSLYEIERDPLSSFPTWNIFNNRDHIGDTLTLRDAKKFAISKARREVSL